MEIKIQATMKNINYYLSTALIVSLLAFFSCETSVDGELDQDINDNDNPVADQLDPEKLTASLKFPGANLVSGKIPAVTGNAEFKIDADTIFWVEGIKKRIRIKSPEFFAGGVSTILVQIPNSESYFEVEPDETQSNDTITSFFFDFDPADWEPPLSFNMDIAVKDKTGKIVDWFPKRPVGIDKKGDFGCSPAGKRFDWLYTTVDGVLNRMEATPEITPGTVTGCCEYGVSFYGYCANSPSERTLAYENYFMQDYEHVKFWDDGFLAGELYEVVRNVDPSKSDFCNNEAGYDGRIIYNTFTGKFSFDPNTGRITLSEMNGQFEKVTIGNRVYDIPLPLYFGNFGDVRMISCHFLVDRGNVDGVMERVFEVRAYEREFRWQD